MQAAPKENLPGHWTEGIDWPGPEYLSARTTGPKSIQLSWRMIDHDTWGNRFFYILSFRNATTHEDEPWKEWPMGSKTSSIEMDGLTPNRRFEIRIGVRKMDPVPGEETITAWSKSAYGQTFLRTYKGEIILAGTDWSNDYMNKYSSKYISITETMSKNLREIFSSQAMQYASSTAKSQLLKFDEFVFKKSSQSHVVAYWKLYFKDSKTTLTAEKIDQAIVGVVSGEVHKKYGLRRTEPIGEANTIRKNLKYFQIMDIDECATKANDCDEQAKVNSLIFKRMISIQILTLFGQI